MQLLCSECGWDNDTRYRFCGMCGAKLPELRPVLPVGAQLRPVPATPASSIGAPSFLGLVQPVDDAADLRRPHSGRGFVLVFCLACAAAAVGYWRGDLRNWAFSLVNGRPAASALEPASYSAAPISTSGSEGAGSMANSRILRENPAVQPKVQPRGQAASTPGLAAAPQTSVKESTQVSNTATLQAPVISQETPAATSPSLRILHSEKGRGITQGPARKLTAQPNSVSEIDRLESEGEKYLYGIGVSVNCARARSNLMAAAERSNPKAESVLGALYATGHCTPPDLALAYRWFAKAHRLEPRNARLAQDLNVLWGQMTSDERRMAAR